MAAVAEWLATAHGASFVWISLAIAFVLVLTRWATLTDGPGLSASLGEVNWSFNDSWATTLTALGALLGTILSTTGVLPASPRPLSTAALGGLNLLFGLLVLLAPLLFSSFARARGSKEGDEGPSYEGTVWAFLVSCVLTIWAVLGELVTIFVLLQELVAGALSESLSWLFLILTALGAVLLGIYSCGTIKATLSFRTETTESAAAGGGTQLRRWSLL